MKFPKGPTYAAIGIALVLGAGWLFILRPVSGWSTLRIRCVGHQRFDSATWRDTAPVYSKEAPRGCMVDDLLAGDRLLGMPMDDVTVLLGVDPPTGYFADFDRVYWLGPERGLFSIDSEWLVIRVDSNRRVSEAKLVTD